MRSSMKNRLLPDPGRAALAVALAASVAAMTGTGTRAGSILLDTIGDGSRFQIGKELSRSVSLGYDAYPVSGDLTGARPAFQPGGVTLNGTTGVPVAQIWNPGAPGQLVPQSGQYAAWIVQPFVPQTSGQVTQVEFIAQIRQTAGYNQGPGRTAFLDILPAPEGETLPAGFSPVAVDLSQAFLGTVVRAQGFSRTVEAGRRYWLVFAPVSEPGVWHSSGLDYANLNWRWKKPAVDGQSVSDALYNNRNGSGEFLPMPGRILGVRLSGSTATPQPARVGEAKQLADGTFVSLEGAVVSAKTGAVGPGFFYVQSPDRSSGIRVVGTSPFDAGSLVNLTGTVASVGPERAILLGSISATSGSAALRPLFIGNSHAGGADSGLQPGVTGGTGLNNVGLLVRVAGIASPSGEREFTVNDGGRALKCRVGAGMNRPESGFVAVTGIVSLELEGTRIVPVILVRDASDITSL